MKTEIKATVPLWKLREELLEFKNDLFENDVRGTVLENDGSNTTWELLYCIYRIDKGNDYVKLTMSLTNSFVENEEEALLEGLEYIKGNLACKIE